MNRKPYQRRRVVFAAGLYSLEAAMTYTIPSDNLPIAAITDAYAIVSGGFANVRAHGREFFDAMASVGDYACKFTFPAEPVGAAPLTAEEAADPCAALAALLRPVTERGLAAGPFDWKAVMVLFLTIVLKAVGG